MDLETCLSQNRETIIQEWARRLHVEGSSDYRSRPRDELARTTSLATDGYFDALIHKNFLKIESFIEKITRMRLKEFALPSVQAAFELYRSITAPILLEALDGACLLDAVQRLNSCLSFRHLFLKRISAFRPVLPVNISVLWMRNPQVFKHYFS